MLLISLLLMLALVLAGVALERHGRLMRARARLQHLEALLTTDEPAALLDYLDNRQHVSPTPSVWVVVDGQHEFRASRWLDAARAAYQFHCVVQDSAFKGVLVRGSK